MYKTILLLVLAVASLGPMAGASAAGAEPGAAPAGPLEVHPDALERYWLPRAAEMKRRVSEARQARWSRAGMATAVKLDYTIDAQGRVRDIEVAETAPAGASPEWAVWMLRQHRFEAAGEARDPVPVRTWTEMRMGPPPGARPGGPAAARIDGSSEEAMQDSLATMMAPLPEAQRTVLLTALLQLAVDGLGSEAEMRERFPDGAPSPAYARSRVDGMTREEILAEAEAASRAEGAPRLVLPDADASPRP
ncbi:hypothetical protein H0E84_09850 [Luteimonas sp. SJ-92]|uniref:Energy transducer TonB n=1 Tax=Luteimonas salinisoli TaxID=2752307 RepID=A0A853JDK4_9GAMM|nr:hypothetical protein [Luteimonas salinisoli]NZA26689.1 hypothetical protein [Luteimonas salinisoli]